MHAQSFAVYFAARGSASVLKALSSKTLRYGCGEAEVEANPVPLYKITLVAAKMLIRRKGYVATVLHCE